MPNTHGRGGLNQSMSRKDTIKSSNKKTPLIQNTSSSESEEENTLTYCAYCPDYRPAMSQASLAKATFCTNCDAAYHPGCIKRCHINKDGSIVECCGGMQASNPDSNLSLNYKHNSTALNSSRTINHSNTNMGHDLTNNELNSILGEKIDLIFTSLNKFDKRISKNENNINKLQNSLSQISHDIHNSTQNNSTDIISTVLSEQEDRAKRQNNIIIYNLPEYNNETPKQEKERKDFFKALTLFNQTTIKELLVTLDPTLKQPIYTKRLGKYQNDTIRPLLLTFDSSNTIKSIFKQIPNLKTSNKFNKIIIKHDLTQDQRSTIKNLKSKCNDLNSKRDDPNTFWGISHTNTNPRITKLSKNKSQTSTA